MKHALGQGRDLHVLRVALICGAGALAGCASTPAPDGAVARAGALVRGAEQDGAAVHAPLELRRAEDLLADARRSLRGENWIRARQSAEKAQVDAELAAALSRRERTRVAVDEMRRTVSALEGEIKNETH